MTPTEAYLFLFCDSIMSSLAMVPNTLMVYPAMKIFGGYDRYYMISTSVAGLTLGSLINYLLGTILHYIKQNVGSHQDSPKFKELTLFINNKLFWISLLSFLPLLGVIITIAAGLFRLRLKSFLPFTILGHILGVILLY